jgi:hypothetical protein
MTDIAETIQESMEQETKNSINSKVALFVAITAEGFQKEYDDINLFDDQFDMTEALLTIAIAMFGITSLTQKKWLLYFAGGVSLIGIILGLTAFMKISLHSDFVSKILG